MKPLIRIAVHCGIACLAWEAHAVDIELLRFTGAKEAQAREFARAQTNSVPSIVWSFFDAVRVDDWETATNLAARLDKARYPGRPSEVPALLSPLWHPISETLGAYEQFHDWDRKWLHRFVREITDSIPKGSVYFGGTDAGRFAVSALSESHRDGQPFFTLTQNQLVDRTYLEYLRVMYGKKLNLLTDDDLRKAMAEYTADAAQRLKAGKLKPGELVRTDREGRVQVSGRVSVMEVNGRLVKMILEKNPNREFYLEESFPLDWMYPHLSPNGLILQLHSKPLSELRIETVQKDQAYRQRLAGELVGNWISDASSVKDICDFSEKIYLRKDLAGFKGDSAFAQDEEARMSFSKVRSAIAGLYLWRTEQARDEDAKNRLRKATELAYKQALALCPTSPEAVFGYSKFLVDLRRHEEAVLVAQTCLRLKPDDTAFQELVRTLHRAE